ncbi:multidrug effflux MFS transporter [Sphingomonas donggukensis]|uniref:Multidrug effflux MFS transporter n=1 Tax=Sphingomonas donggukensis TaxID=2949093 RepID=A0ABY4TQ50_9SPHN|nr:multidrug effflux MFS transporter [Sphingomonas donggukensis]URW74516.1 multidrug effflux MFS transporter [Sphingomonas donggukensis]
MTHRTMTGHAPEDSQNRAPIGFVEFVALIAALMALTALGIDSMLPALPAIADALDVAEPNRRQFVITAFMVGFAFAMLVYGPMTDRFGRRRVLVVALVGYVATNLLAAISGSFDLLLIARLASGAMVAGARTVTVALVRDCFSGRAMARVMSLAFIVFMAAPVLAPTFGQLILLFASWRWIFGGIALVTACILAWFVLRMPETLAIEDRRPLRLGLLVAGTKRVAGDRYAVGYTLAATMLQGALFGFIGSIQQIVFDVFRVPHLLAVVFASVAGTMAVGSFLNSRIVMKLGTRLISHTALIGFIIFAVAHLMISLSGAETLANFIVVQALMMACFGLATSNFSAMAMENMGDIAGTAASLQGFVATLGAALIGAYVGQSYDGTTVPLYVGFTTMGVLALVIVLVAERGRLFRPAHEPAARRA